MIRVVLDTNVLVSGLLNPKGPPATLVRMLGAGILTPCYDERIMREYEAVLRRPAFRFRPEHVTDLLSLIRSEGESVLTTGRLRGLPDLNDEPFLEVASAGLVAHLVTGNARHFPPSLCSPVSVVSPSQFLAGL
jgi:putative PIN family toxin of toxin-antitoxin system